MTHPKHSSSLADVEMVEDDPQYIFRFPTPPDAGQRATSTARVLHSSGPGDVLQPVGECSFIEGVLRERAGDYAGLHLLRNG